MYKQNQKGFTLIEILVVVAMIAVLAAILIPTTSSALIKAKAAADATNLRTLAAEAAINYLDGKDETEGLVHYSAPNTFTVCNAPAARTKGYEHTAANVSQDTGSLAITAKYGTKDSSYFAAIAETGKFPSGN